MNALLIRLQKNIHLLLVDIIWNVENNKFSKSVQTFYDLKEYTTSLIEELVYIDSIETNYLQNEIDYSNFNQDEFDSIKICKYCNSEF